MAELKLAEKTYEDAYAAYTSEKFNDAISISDDALKNTPRISSLPSFYLSGPIPVGKVTDEKKFREELNNLIKLWPQTSRVRKLLIL